MTYCVIFGNIHQCDGDIINWAAATTPSVASRISTGEVKMENSIKVNSNFFVYVLILFGITLTSCGVNSRVFNDNGE